MADQIRINGRLLSWGSITAKLNGERYTGFTDINFGEKLEKALIYGLGASQAPRGNTRGKYTPDPIKLTGWAGSVETFCSSLAAQSDNGISYGNVQFAITVIATEEGDTPVSVEAFFCSVAGRSGTYSEGSEGLKEDLEITVQYYKRNGKTLFDSSEGGF